jgi:hypothetical protein
LLDLGFDSLMAVELRSKLTNGLALTKTLPATLIFDYPTIEAMANFLSKQLDADTNDANEPEPTLFVKSNSSPASSDLAGMSDEEIEALLLKKLENI